MKNLPHKAEPKGSAKLRAAPWHARVHTMTEPYKLAPQTHNSSTTAPFAANAMADLVKTTRAEAEGIDRAAAPADRDIGGCYAIKCVPMGGCCVGCVFNASGGDCMCPIHSFVPFSCCVLPYSREPPGGGWASAKRDSHIFKIDAQAGTLGCYMGSSLCCLCTKM
jgi:hypothetical protein